MLLERGEGVLFVDFFGGEDFAVRGADLFFSGDRDLGLGDFDLDEAGFDLGGIASVDAVGGNGALGPESVAFEEDGYVFAAGLFAEVGSPTRFGEEDAARFAWEKAGERDAVHGDDVGLAVAIQADGAGADRARGVKKKRAVRGFGAAEGGCAGGDVDGECLSRALAKRAGCGDRDFGAEVGLEGEEGDAAVADADLEAHAFTRAGDAVHFGFPMEAADFANDLEQLAFAKDVGRVFVVL